MSLFKPHPPPYDPLEWRKWPFAERARAVCQSWAVEGYGAPLGVYVIYAIKILFYIQIWVLFCRCSPRLGGLLSIGQWWLEPLAFQKAILWSMLFEGLGFGCGSGPLTGPSALSLKLPSTFSDGSLKRPSQQMPSLLPSWTMTCGS